MGEIEEIYMPAVLFSSVPPMLMQSVSMAFATWRVRRTRALVKQKTLAAKRAQAQALRAVPQLAQPSVAKTKMPALEIVIDQVDIELDLAQRVRMVGEW